MPTQARKPYSGCVRSRSFRIRLTQANTARGAANQVSLMVLADPPFTATLSIHRWAASLSKVTVVSPSASSQTIQGGEHATLPRNGRGFDLSVLAAGFEQLDRSRAGASPSDS
jgi:hypothetical protein